MAIDYTLTVPLILIASLGTLMLAAEVISSKSSSASYGIGLAGLALIGAILYPGVGTAWGIPVPAGAGGFFSEIFVVAAFLTMVLSRGYLKRQGADNGEYYVLVVFSVAGMMTMALATDLVMLFLGLEIMSICLYVLAGFLRVRLTGNEAALKYFLLGAFISGFILYGIALVYGATGSLSIDALVDGIHTPGQSALFWAGAILIFAGFAFKVGAFPFHMWIPDVYQGAPTPVTAFMATGAKAAAFSVLLMLFARRITLDSGVIRDVAAFLAAGSMIVGNLLAIAQQNVKRMLAYSSVAHAGYMLVGIAAGNSTGSDGVSFYLVSYLFMNLGALGIVSMLEETEERHLSYEEYAGLSSRSPVASALLAVFLFSLAGLPPFGGFFGKYFVFVAAIESGLTWLAVLGVLASLVGVYYYLRLVMVMYFREAERPDAAAIPRFAIGTLVVAALINLQIGVLPSSIISLIHSLR